MPFNSLEYLFLFLPPVALLYFVWARFAGNRAGTLWLIAASLIFYGYGAASYLPLLCISLLLNFAFGLLLRQEDRPGSGKKSILAGAITANLLLLGYCKYANFFIETANQSGLTTLPLLTLTLPLAISFYTFQQISYLVDCAQAKINKSNLLDYGFFVLFFPQMIAGPILRYAEIVPQLRQQHIARVNWDNVARGIFVFTTGLFKKVVIADSFGAWSPIAAPPGQAIGCIDAWLTSLCYTFQLYYDFSGYTDMAIGAALLFNIRLPVNFNSPYQAGDIQEFWRRWHMTLSRWLRDYLYIPLGGSRKGTGRTLANIFITFLLGGIWHGAGWTFLVWGGLHGAALALHRAWRMTGRRMNMFWGRLTTLLFLNLAWVYFQSPSVAQANRLIRAMIGLETQQTFIQEVAARYAAWQLMPLTDLRFPQSLSMVMFALAVFLVPNTMELIGFIPSSGRWQFRTTHRYALLTGLLLTLSLMTFMGSTGSNEFIYFQF